MPNVVGYKGRTVALTWNGAAVPGVREKSFKMNGAVIDISSDEDNGWMQLLNSDVQESSVDITLAGVSKSKALKTSWFAGGANRAGTLVVTYPDGGVLSGTFVISDFGEKMPYKDAVTFDATLKSSGVVTYVPGA